MALSVRSRRISIAAGVLSLALVAPAVAVPESPFAVFATAATTTANFDDRYETENFWEKNEARVKDLSLEPGDKVEPTTNTIFNWKFRNDGGTLVLIRPQSAAAFKTGNQDIRVNVTPSGGKAFTTTLRVNVVDEEPTLEENTTSTPPSQSSAEVPTSTETQAEPSPSDGAGSEEQLSVVPSSAETTSSDQPSSEETSAPATTTTAPTEPVTTTTTTPPTTATQTAASPNFNQRYSTENFWDKNEAAITDLQLAPGDKVEPTTNTIFNWRFRNDNGTLVLVRPQSPAGYKSGNVDIPVKVTSANGASTTTTLRVNVVDQNPNPTTASSQPTAETAPRVDLSQRFETENFWNADEAPINGLEIDPGTTVAATTNTIFNWRFRNDNGTLVLIRPQSPTGYNAGDQDIRVRITPPDGAAYTDTLKVTVVDKREAKDWEEQLRTRYPLDFGKSTAAQPVAEITLPDGVTVSKNGAALPTGWGVKNDGNTIRVTPPSTFKEGDFDLPIRVNDGTDSFDATLKIAATNPSQTPADTAGTVAGILGPLLGGLLGGGGGLLGGLLGGGGSGGGTGNGGEGGGAGRLINVVITGNANPSNIGNNNGSPNVIVTNNANPNVIITDNVNPRDNLSNNGNPVITNNANPNVVITNNANPTVDIKDNLSNNGNPSVVITDNANPRDNLNNNGNNNGNPSVVITDNANPRDNLNNNGNPVITGNANPSNNGNNNGSNNSAVVTGNANPVVTGNANPVITGNANPSNNGNNNGSNNSASAVVTGNANPVITGNANPSNNGNNNGSNNSAVGTGNANPVVTGNANPSNNGNNNGSNNSASAVVTNNANPSNNGNPNVEVKDNANPVVTGNANPNVEVKDNVNPSVVVTDNANPRDNLNNNGSNNSAVVTGNANPSNNGNPNVEVKDNANPDVVVTDNANGGLFGSSKKNKDKGDASDAADQQSGSSGSSGSSLIDVDADVQGGSSDPRCIASLVGLGIPLIALVPLALAQGLNIPGLNQASAQAAGAFNAAVRQFGVQPAEATAVAGGIAGIVLATIVAAAVSSCIPKADNVKVNVGGRTTVTQTVVPTQPTKATEPTA